MFGEGNKENRTQRNRRSIVKAEWAYSQGPSEMGRGGPRKLMMVRSLYISDSWL